MRRTRKRIKTIVQQECVGTVKRAVKKVENRRTKDGRSIPRKVKAATTG